MNNVRASARPWSSSRARQHLCDGNNSVFLDPVTKTQLATGNPNDLRDNHPNFEVRNFLQQGKRHEQEISPTVIGAFVVGAVVLLVIGVAVFGGAELLAARQTYVTYFTQDTKGLRVGSNVSMNGVVIGQVSKMALILEQDNLVEQDPEDDDRIFPGNYIAMSDGEIVGEGPGSVVSHEELINVGGLQATLAAEDFVTGQLLVEMSFSRTNSVSRR